MEATHTPGPWTVQSQGPDSWIDVPCDAPKYRRDICRLSFGNEDGKANARLIAAAPELLEALEEIVAEWDAGNIGRLTAIPGTPGWEESVGVKWAREAIAKATGTPS